LLRGGFNVENERNREPGDCDHKDDDNPIVWVFHQFEIQGDFHDAAPVFAPVYDLIPLATKPTNVKPTAAMSTTVIQFGKFH
jgi:hypothetical protein